MLVSSHVECLPFVVMFISPHNICPKVLGIIKIFVNYFFHIGPGRFGKLFPLINKMMIDYN